MLPRFGNSYKQWNKRAHDSGEAGQQNKLPHSHGTARSQHSDEPYGRRESTYRTALKLKPARGYASALWQAGQHNEAIVIAERLSLRLAHRRTLLASQSLDAYGALADVYLSRWEQAQDEAESKRFALAAHKACRSLRWFARSFLMATPAALRSTARERWMAGKHRSSRRAWHQSVRSANRLEMPYWEACAHRDLAKHAATKSERSSHRTKAQQIFRTLGANSLGSEM